MVDYQGPLEGSRVHLPSAQEDTFARFGHSIFVSPKIKNISLIGGYSKVKQRDNIFAVFKKEISWPLIDQTTFPSQRTLFCAVASTSEMAFLFGGRASPRDPSNDMFSVDLKTRDVIEILSSGQKPSPRWKHSLTTVTQNLLVMVGGRDSENVFDDVCIFDCQQKKWVYKHR